MITSARPSDPALSAFPRSPRTASTPGGTGKNSCRRPAEVIDVDQEQRGTEFKGPGRRDDKDFMAKVTRAILAMANKEDGGIVVIGVADNGTTLTASGVAAADLSTWRFDDVQASVSNYADPYVEFDVGAVELDAKRFVAISVRPFLEYPVLCKKDHDSKGNPPRPILRQGALYVRGRGKIETVAASTHIEMRDVLDRAAEATARRLIGISIRIRPKASDEDKFRSEAEDLE
jgi:hypothetical protein